MYFVVRPKGQGKSQTVKQEIIDKMQSTYKINMREMYENVRDCNNAGMVTGDRPVGGIYVGASKYPSCWFDIAYIHSESTLDKKVIAKDVAHNADTVPQWVFDWNDGWNEPNERYCSILSDDIPTCYWYYNVRKRSIDSAPLTIEGPK